MLHITDKRTICFLLLKFVYLKQSYKGDFLLSYSKRNTILLHIYLHPANTMEHIVTNNSKSNYINNKLWKFGNIKTEMCGLFNGSFLHIHLGIGEFI